MLGLVVRIGFGSGEQHQEFVAAPSALDVARAQCAGALSGDGRELVYSYETQSERHGITRLLEELFRRDIRVRDIDTTQTTLEEIFVDLVKQ